jgi:hypothetical protein
MTGYDRLDVETARRLVSTDMRARQAQRPVSTTKAGLATGALPGAGI